MYRMPPVGQFDGDGRCECSFTNAALPHRHYDSVPHLFEFVDQDRKGKSGMDHAGQVPVHRQANRRFAAEHAPEVLHTHRSVWQQRNFDSRKFRELTGNPGECFLAAAFECARGGIAAILRNKDAVQKQPLIGDAHFRQLRSCSIRFDE